MQKLTRCETVLLMLLTILGVGFYPAANLAVQLAKATHIGMQVALHSHQDQDGQPKNDKAPMVQDPVSDREAQQEPVIRTAVDFFKHFDDPEALPFSLPRREIPVEEALKVVRELRRRYPVISLADRLEKVNSKARIEALRDLYPQTADVLANSKNTFATEASRSLESVSSPKEPPHQQNLHVGALIQLHSSKSVEFVNQPGFGFSRMPTITPQFLKYPEVGPLALNTRTGTAATYSDEPLVELPKKYDFDNRAIDPGNEPLPANRSTSSFADAKDTGGQVRLPAREDVEQLNLNSVALFSSDYRMGVHNGVFGVEQLEAPLEPKSAIGFLGHGIDYLHAPTLGVAIFAKPDRPQPRDVNSWDLNRLELVSLMMNDGFRVYVSESLPKMEELRSAETRPLDSFEYISLGRLFQSEDVVIESSQNRVRMLGALRAQDHCLKCHDVKRGELLGALSYELIRQIPNSEN